MQKVKETDIEILDKTKPIENPETLLFETKDGKLLILSKAETFNREVAYFKDLKTVKCKGDKLQTKTIAKNKAISLKDLTSVKTRRVISD